MIEQVKNIDIVQIKVSTGTLEYEFPRNVQWSKRKVNKIVLFAPTNACLSPIDGTTSVLTKSQIADLYFDLYDADNGEIAHNLHFSNLVNTNNHPIRIDKQLELSLCRLFFTTAPAANGCLLLYVFYDGVQTDDFKDPKQSITVTFPMAANERKSFREIVDTYIHASYLKVRAIQVWNAASNPAYLTLRDYSLEHVINSLHTEMARPQMVGATAENTQLDTLYIDSMDIDFDYSFIVNATASSNNQTITFEF